MKSVNILGYETSACGLACDVDQAWRLMSSGRHGHYVACSNPHSLVEARNDEQFSRALASADILLPDGVGIVIAAKLLNLDMEERVAGSEFFREMSVRAQKKGGVRYFFMGSTDRVLQLIVDRMRREFPAIEVCGVYSPPFKDELDDADNAEIIRRVNEAKPDVLWVGMTAPKQEKWILNNKDKLQVPLAGAIGAVFDFYAGTKKRAPKWVCDIGLEWLPRLLREPVRLFRRNLVSTPVFLYLVMKQKLKRRSMLRGNSHYRH